MEAYSRLARSLIYPEVHNSTRWVYKISGWWALQNSRWHHLITPQSSIETIEETFFSTIQRTKICLPSDPNSPTNARIRWIAIKSSTTHPRLSKEPHDIIKELQVLSNIQHPNVRHCSFCYLHTVYFMAFYMLSNSPLYILDNPHTRLWARQCQDETPVLDALYPLLAQEFISLNGALSAPSTLFFFPPYDNDAKRNEICSPC